MWPFRYLGQHQRIIEIYECFAQAPRQALHPAEISRQTGISLTTVSELLEQTPELFVRILKRSDGLTRYRLASVLAGQSRTQVEAKVQRAMRTEQLTLYTVLFMVISVIAVTIVMSFPWSVLLGD
ncbi:MAG: helix-turn-helix domain-containing protein [Pseudomonadales bacterium]